MTIPAPAVNATTEHETSELPLVTINILAYNRREEVRTTLRKVTGEIGYPKERLEVILVDNASVDGTSEMVRREFPEVKLITIENNCGIAGWNRGFAEGRGDYFLVLDDDSAPETGLTKGIEYLEQNPPVGILACNIIGNFFTAKDWTLKDQQSWIGFIGCGAIIRRSVYERVGGYADWIHMYAHEWEYGIRCLDAGYEIRFLEDCIVRHRASAVNRSSRKLITYSLRNELLMVYKHFPKHRLLYYWRVLVNQTLHHRPQGLKAIPYLFHGFAKFLAEAPRQQRTYVKDAVQSYYVSEFGTVQPVLPRLFAKLGRMVGLLPKM